MILMANGCSHTAGAEIEHPQQGACYDKAWPKFLAEKLDAEKWDNLSMSGASCHRVVRTTFEYLHEHAQKYNYNFKNLFIVILWPGWYRTEIHSDEEQKHNFYDNGWAPLVTGNDDSYKETFEYKDYLYYRSWVTSIDRHHHIIDYLQQILLLQNTFQKYGIKYLFWNASMSTLDRNPRYAPWLNHINPKRFPRLYDTLYCFTELCRRSDQQISKHSIESGFASHYDEEAHRWFSDFIYNYTLKNSIF